MSRWLLTAVGPYINLTSGISSDSWPRFALWDVLAEVVWVLGDFTGAALGLAAPVILVYMLIRTVRTGRAKRASIHQNN